MVSWPAGYVMRWLVVMLFALALVFVTIVLMFLSLVLPPPLLEVTERSVERFERLIRYLGRR
jgi:hypothetical protein